MDKPFLLIFNDKEEAAYYLNDLEQLNGEKNVLFYPGSYRRPYQIEEKVDKVIEKAIKMFLRIPDLDDFTDEIKKVNK
jgi:hypothetical protein